jgi:hypothetical protein
MTGLPMGINWIVMFGMVVKVMVFPEVMVTVFPEVRFNRTSEVNVMLLCPDGNRSIMVPISELAFLAFSIDIEAGTIKLTSISKHRADELASLLMFNFSFAPFSVF